MNRVEEVLVNKEGGLHYGNRIILPFSCTILKMVVDDEILLDFSPRSKDVTLIDKDSFMEIYLHTHRDLSEDLTKYESIKMIVVDKNSNIFDFKNHKKISIHLEEHHKLKIEELDKDILFIE